MRSGKNNNACDRVSERLPLLQIEFRPIPEAVTELQITPMTC